MFWHKKKAKEPRIEECALEEVERTGPFDVYGIKFKRGDRYFFKLMGRIADGHWLEFCSLGYSGRESLEFKETSDYVEQVLEGKEVTYVVES